jgi:hypothetical protein
MHLQAEAVVTAEPDIAVRKGGVSAVLQSHAVYVLLKLY